MITNHKPPALTGIFEEQAAAFLEFKRSIGYKYSSEAKVLSRFCRFSCNYLLEDVSLPRKLVEAWIAPLAGEAAKSRSHRMSCVRQFALYLIKNGYTAYVLPEQKNWNRTSFTPYIFTKQEIGEILRAADRTLPCEQSRNMHLALPVIFRILYGCGLRVSEALKLQYRDVDLSLGILTIRDAKFGKDRLIPMSASLVQACTCYSEKIWWNNDSEYFFMAPDRTMISPNTVYQRFRRYLEVSGISHGGKNHGPRLHDVRHTFSVHVLQQWIRDGNDLTAMLPILSTYLGHKSLKATASYLRLTAEVYPELMADVEAVCAYVIPNGGDQ